MKTININLSFINDGILCVNRSFSLPQYLKDTLILIPEICHYVNLH
jgi:hypothetical protein